jgi:Tol biopolymer transport system component
LAPGAEPAALTDNGRQNVQPAWSPDGQYLAYHEMAGGGIWVVPSRGGVPRQVSTFGAHPAWSPDGRRLAFQSLPVADLSPLRAPGVPSTIWTVEAGGGSAPVPLTVAGEPAGPHLAPAWQGDRNIVVFSVPAVPASGRAGALWMIDAGGGKTRMLASHELLSTTYALVPGGRGAYFAAAGSGVIWWLPLVEDAEDGPRPTGLPSAGSTIAHLTVTPDGRQLAWTVVDSSGHIWAVDYDPPRRRAADVRRAGPLTEGTGIHYGFPFPSDDGRLALVVSRHGAPPGLSLLAPGRGLRQLTTDAASHTRPHWTPGASEVAFLANHGTGVGIWAIEPSSGRERLLFLLADVDLPGADAPAISTIASIALSPRFDGLAMSVVREGVPNIWTVPLRDLRPAGRAVQVSFERDGGTHPSWSPDGRSVLYQCGDGSTTQACVVGADGTGRAQVTDDRGQSWSGSWGPDPDTILLAARRNGLWNVTEISRTTRAERLLTAFDSPRLHVRYPRWDAAGRRVVFERGETAARIWSIDIK